MTGSRSNKAIRKKMTAGLALVLTMAATHPATAGSLALDEGHSQPAPIPAGETRVDWSRARVWPLAVALAANEARREAAANVTELVPGPDGHVDLALSRVIDLTLRNNLDLLVRSYAPALNEEQLKARQAIYDPLLTFLVSLASSNNPATSTLSGAEVVSSDTSVWNGAIEQLIPLGGVAALTFDNRRDETNSTFTSLNPAYSSALQLDLTQPLLRNFGKDVTEREIRIARNDEQAAREGYRDDVMAKVTEAISAYWDLAGAIKNLEARNEGLHIAQELLKINRTRVEVGTMAPLDISLAEAEVADNEKSVIEAEELVHRAEDNLRALVNVPLGSLLWRAPLRPIDPPTFETRPLDVDTAIATAFAQRSDIRQQQLSIQNADIRVSYAKNQVLPALNLVARYGTSGIGGTRVVREGGPFGDGPVTTLDGGYGDALDQMMGFDYDNWALGLNFSFPLFNRLARANQAQTYLARSAELDRLELLKQVVSVEVRRLVRTVETNLKRIDAAQAAHKFQKERLSAETKKFEHGLSTNFEVQQAQRDLTSARVSEIVTRLEYVKGVADLERAMGTVLETHGVRIDE